MKNIFIYADENMKNLVCFDKKTKLHILTQENLPIPNNISIDNNYLIVDADLANNKLEEIIITYQKYQTKIFAYTNNTTKQNILKLHSLGIHNIIPAPTNINDLIQNIINPNKDIINDEITETNKPKKLLLLSDNKINTELLFQSLIQFEFTYTIKSLIEQKAIKQEIEKNLFDLIVIDTISKNENDCEILKFTQQSKLNKNTPIIFLSDTTIPTENQNSDNYGITYYIQKPYTPNLIQTQIKNIIKIKDLQNELKRENNLLENMISNSFNQLIITDSNFNILAFGNQHIQVEKNEYFFNILRKENMEFPEELIRIFSRTSEKTFNFNTKHNDKIFKVIISKVFNEIEFCDKYLIILEDITEKLLIEEQKETFIATLTHDLKTPIRAEQNILKQMINGTFGDLTDTQKNILQEILNSKEYESKMIDNLLMRYHASSNEFRIFIEQNSYKNTINAVLNETAYMFKAKEQTITLQYNAQTDNFEYDNTEIKRVLLNLLQNASEYTQKNGKINIIIEENESFITTTIKDNGFGIEQEDLKQIFDKNITLAKKYRKVGSGLGLYICKTLIEAHNGTICAQSEPSRGSSFTFSLPKKH